ncbi:MAG: 2-hydroxyacid dehydrogenase [Bacillota bacterium]|nr:2-hydroxyacid dehydrogenase [Bacillota bacterium]
MRVVVGARSFGDLFERLPRLLPGTEVLPSEPGRLAETLRRVGGADVIVPGMSPVDEAVLEQAPGVRLVQQWGAGLDTVDIDACSRRGVPVANVPSAGTGNAESVAEWALLGALAVSRRIEEARRNLDGGSATWGRPVGRLLMGKAALVVGLGGIGQLLAPRLRALGMHVWAVRRRGMGEDGAALVARLGLEGLGGPADLPDLLPRMDALFLCLPLGPESYHLIDGKMLARMKPGAVLVNAGRGGLVDGAALAEALHAGRLGGAALDVFEREPLPADDPLRSAPNLFLTPHIAGVTEESYAGIGAAVAENLRRVEQGLPPLHCVNAAALTRRSSAAGGRPA